MRSNRRSERERASWRAACWRMPVAGAERVRTGFMRSFDESAHLGGDHIRHRALRRSIREEVHPAPVLGSVAGGSSQCRLRLTHMKKLACAQCAAFDLAKSRQAMSVVIGSMKQ